MPVDGLEYGHVGNRKERHRNSGSHPDTSDAVIVFEDKDASSWDAKNEVSARSDHCSILLLTSGSDGRHRNSLSCVEEDES